MSFRHCSLSLLVWSPARRPRPPEEQPIQRQRARAKAACMPDAMRLCRDAVPNVQQRAALLRPAPREDQQPLPHGAGELRAAISVLCRRRSVRSRE